MSRKTTDTRRAILDATWKLMEEKGGAGVRMRDIAAAAGVSRQAVYLHFGSRTELLVATTRHADTERGVGERFRRTGEATTGLDRLDAWVEAWGSYIPEIHGIASALLAARDTDEAAAAAWDDRMAAVRNGCNAAVKALKRDGDLAPEWSVGQATDILFTMLSIRRWEELTAGCGWTQKQYVKRMKRLARRALCHSVATPDGEKTR